MFLIFMSVLHCESIFNRVVKNVAYEFIWKKILLVIAVQKQVAVVEEGAVQLCLPKEC
jgi:hypothetical protein